MLLKQIFGEVWIYWRGCPLRCWCFLYGLLDSLMQFITSCKGGKKTLTGQQVILSNNKKKAGVHLQISFIHVQLNKFTVKHKFTQSKCLCVHVCVCLCGRTEKICMTKLLFVATQIKLNSKTQKLKGNNGLFIPVHTVHAWCEKSVAAVRVQFITVFSQNSSLSFHNEYKHSLN